MSMIETVRQILERAAGTGEVIRIVYHGGSQPCSVREITSITVTHADLVVTGVRRRRLAGHNSRTTFELSALQRGPS